MTRRYPLLLIATLALLLGACGLTKNSGKEKGSSGPSNTSSSEATWEQTLDRVVKGVVVLRVTTPRDFDTETAGSYVGTGFIVDKKRGIILSNRHLVQPGPVVSEAVFLNHEEVDLQPIYRDPVHDFGFFKYDPSKVKFSDLEEISLAPESARVGIDIRVVGNDAGEKLSILSGILARLDRSAPDYGSFGYNDFNTFYYQAASGTSGGSSGSPVINIDGAAVALNAGGAFLAESSFFLPLDRVVRALELVQAGEDVTRGSLQTIFRYQPFDELRRLGLPQELEERVRESFPGGVGMLVVDEVVPGGPADGILEPGDIISSIGGELMTQFVPLEELLDSSVGGSVDFTIVRGGVESAVTVSVEDLHALMPREFIEVGGAMIHPISFQQARNFRMPVEGLYVANSGYAFGQTGVSWGSVIRSIDGVPVENLDDLWEVVTSRPDRERIQVRFSPPYEPDIERTAVAYLDRRWFPTRRCTLEPSTGSWPCVGEPSAQETWKPKAETVSLPEATSDVGKLLSKSMVIVEFTIPFPVEGIYSSSYVGAGLVLDKERGLVVTDRDTVPIFLGDIQLAFGSLRIPGKVEYVHPVHNFSIVSYDPALLGSTPVASAKLDTTPVKEDDKLWQVAITRDYSVVSTESKVSRIKPLALPFPDIPAFRESNLEIIEFGGSSDNVGGVLANADGSVRALWASFTDLAGYNPLQPTAFRGIPIEIVEMVAAPLRAGKDVSYRSLGLELTTMNLADVREYGVSDARIKELEQHPAGRRQAISLLRTYTNFPSSQVLTGGDILLAVNGKPMATFLELERAAYQADQVTLNVLRDGKEMEVEVPTRKLSGEGVSRIVAWSGLMIHEPHLAIAAQRSRDLPAGVYTAWANSGSPASHYGVGVALMIVEVNGTPTPDLDAFIAAISQLEDRQPVRLKTFDLDGLEQMLTLRTDHMYWPTAELDYEKGRWTRRAIP